MSAVWSTGTFAAFFLGQFICFFIPRYPLMLRYPHQSDLIASTYFLYRLHMFTNKTDSMLVLASFAVAALSEQVRILLLGTFLNTRSFAHLRIAIAWDKNTAERLLIVILSHWLSLGP
jgi:hypothetical protein